NLKKIESQLNIYKFVRIHKSYIVSLKHINKIEKETVHILKNKLPIGGTYKLKLKETIKNYKLKT
ncbi:MAG: LytTR family transcriptional regulator DNA-binding domain-containing protein, partial [Sphingobacteriales bacterium]